MPEAPNCTMATRSNRSNVGEFPGSEAILPFCKPLSVWSQVWLVALANAGETDMHAVTISVPRLLASPLDTLEPSGSVR